MAKNYDDIGGVWRTIGGRRVFIKTGQSLSEAMIESGKFKNLRSDYRKAKEEEKSSAKGKIDYMGATRELMEADHGDWNNMDQQERTKTCEKILEDFEDKYGNLEDEEFRGKLVDQLEEENFHTMANVIDAKYGEIDNNFEKVNTQFEVSDLKAKAIETLPKEHIDTHGSDLYIKKTKESEALLNNMKDKDSGLLSTFKDQQTGETWYDIPFANMQDDYENKTIDQLNDEMLGDKYKGSGSTPNLVYSTGRRIDIANNVDGGKTATIWKDGKIERKTNLPDNVKGDKTKDYFDDYLSQLDGVDKKEGFTQYNTQYGGTREYDKEQLDRMAEHGTKPMKNSYSGYGWEGTKYDSSLSTKDIAKNINEYSKKEFPDVKLSRKTDYNGVDLYVTSSDKDLYIDDKYIDSLSNKQLIDLTNDYGNQMFFDRWAKDNVPSYSKEHSFTADDVRRYMKEDVAKARQHEMNVSGDEYFLSDYGKKVISGLNKEMNSYNYDDSDGQIDYFNTNFYGYVHIGKYGKPYQVNQKATGETINNTLRQKAYQKYLKEHPGSKITFNDFKDMRK